VVGGGAVGGGVVGGGAVGGGVVGGGAVASGVVGGGVVGVPGAPHPNTSAATPIATIGMVHVRLHGLPAFDPHKRDHFIPDAPF
jgi:hypothetical protein